MYEYTHTVNMNDQEESGYHNNLSTILTTKLILEETKRISRQCVEEKLEEYSEDDFAFEEIKEMIGEEVRGRNWTRSAKMDNYDENFSRTDNWSILKIKFTK